MMKNLQLSAGEASTSMMMHDYCTAEKKAGEREMEIASLRPSEGNPSEALIGSVMEIEEEGALKWMRRHLNCRTIPFICQLNFCFRIGGGFANYMKHSACVGKRQ